MMRKKSDNWSRKLTLNGRGLPEQQFRLWSSYLYLLIHHMGEFASIKRSRLMAKIIVIPSDDEYNTWTEETSIN